MVGSLLDIDPNLRNEWWAVLDLNQRPKDSSLREFPHSLDYFITHSRTVGVPGARGTLIGLAPHVLVSAPSRLPVLRPAFGGLGSRLPLLSL
jgi:hypothetical protein